MEASPEPQNPRPTHPKQAHVLAVRADVPHRWRRTKGSPVAAARAPTAAWPTVWKQWESASSTPSPAGARFASATT